MENSKKPQRINFSDEKNKIYSTAEMRRRIKQVIDYDFEADVTVYPDKGTVYKETKKPILSPSTMNHQASKLAMVKIPDDILEKRRKIGTNLMIYFERWFKEKPKTWDELEMDDVDFKNLINLISFFKENKIKIWAVEKYVTNGEIGGFIDCIGIWNEVPVIFEIKCRNKHEIRTTDIIQACAYKALLWNATTYVLMMDDNGKVSYYQVKRKMDKTYGAIYNNTIRYFQRIGLLSEKALDTVRMNDGKDKTETNKVVSGWTGWMMDD